jgi:hypothetical protein
MEEVIDGRREGIDGRREGIVFCVYWVSLIECYGTCLRGFILFFILILIKKK